MARKRYTSEEIIGQLRTIEIELGKGLALVEACRKLGITEQTYYRWKKEYGGLRVDQAKRLKSLEQENVRLIRLVADLSLDSCSNQSLRFSRAPFSNSAPFTTTRSPALSPS
jgi:putative transposase